MTLAEAVQIDIDPTNVLALAGGGFLFVVTLFFRREWAAHRKQIARILKRLSALERKEPPPPEIDE